MEIEHAVEKLAALAQASRLRVFRLLVESGPAGLPAGAVARHLGIPNNTLSAHLAVLSRAGLVQAQRDGRSMIYSADFEGARALLGYLMRDCCKGPPELCAPLLDAVLPGTAAEPRNRRVKA